MLLSSTRAPAQIVKAPWPDTLSTQALASIAANDARPPEPAAMPDRRARAESIQQAIGVFKREQFGQSLFIPDALPPRP